MNKSQTIIWDRPLYITRVKRKSGNRTSAEIRRTKHGEALKYRYFHLKFIGYIGRDKFDLPIFQFLDRKGDYVSVLSDIELIYNKLFTKNTYILKLTPLKDRDITNIWEFKLDKIIRNTTMNIDVDPN